MENPEQGNVSPQDLLFVIGELTVENRLLRGQLAELKQAQESAKTVTPVDASAN